MQIPKRYNHLEVVGKGSYGMVCSAVDSVRNNAPFAIKKITPMAAHRYVIRARRVIDYYSLQYQIDLCEGREGSDDSVSCLRFPFFCLFRQSDPKLLDRGDLYRRIDALLPSLYP